MVVFEPLTEFSKPILQLAWTCYNFYQSTPTKLAGENYYFNAGQVSYLIFCLDDER